jgi:hypothetical protein
MEQRLRLVQGGAGARTEKRSAERIPMRVSAQVAWKDAHGRTQIAAVTTADVSEQGVRIECRGSLTLPLYRLVYFHVDRQARNRPDLPELLKRQTVLSAVFRVGPASQVTGTPTEYALRLLVEPAKATGSGWAGRRSGRTRTA